MPPPIPRCSNWAYPSLNSPSCFSLPRYGSRVGLHIFLFEACSTFTRVAACTLALSPIRDTLIEGFSHFVTSVTAPIASGWSGCRVGLAPTGKRRLVTAHAKCRHRPTRSLAGASSNRIALELSGRKGADHFITSAPDAPDHSTGADHSASSPKRANVCAACSASHRGMIFAFRRRHQGRTP